MPTVADIKKKINQPETAYFFYFLSHQKVFLKNELLKFCHYLLNHSFEVHKTFLQTVLTTEAAGDLF